MKQSVNIAHSLSCASAPFVSPVALTLREAEALSFLMPLSEDYPGIDRWFCHKVVPGLRSGTRFLLAVERNSELIGLGIAKNEGDERKICTVRVSPHYAGRGVGVRLFDGLLKWLDDDHPHLTVTATKLPSFERIFDYYGFSVTSAHDGRYVPQAIELGYNEPLVSPFKVNACEKFGLGLMDPKYCQD